MRTHTSKDQFTTISSAETAGEAASPSTATGPALAELVTSEGTFLIQERRSAPRDPAAPKSPAKAEAPKTYASSPQMMGLGGLIIIGVLVGSYTTKYDLAIGHAGGALAVPTVSFLALQLFLARAAFRVYDDVRTFARLLDFVVSRAFRYMPAVVPSVLLGFVLINTLRIPSMHAAAASLPANLFLMADLVGATDIDSSHWRLKIEIIQAVLVAAAWFGPARRHLPVLLTLALAINAVSINGEPLRHNVLSLHGLMTNDGYLPLFVYGIALHQFTQDRSSRVWPAMLVSSGTLAFLSNTPIHGAWVVAALLVLTSIATGGLQWLGSRRWLNHLGEIAFPIYVAHYVLGFAIIHHLEAMGCAPVIAISIASVAAIAVGKSLNAYIERPIQAHAPAAIKAVNAALGRVFTKDTELQPGLSYVGE